MMTEEGKELYIAYPPEGKKLVPAGRIEIKWKENKAYLPDGTSEALSSVLPSDRVLRSLFLMTERQGTLQLQYGTDINLKNSILPSSTSIKNIAFDYTIFKTTEPTKIYMLASTNPEGAQISEMRTPVPVIYGYQQEWESLWEVDNLSPGKVTSYVAYTVPKGHRLLFKGGFAFCNVGCIQKVWITRTPGILGDFNFDRLGAFGFEPSSEVTEGKTITYYFFNNSTKKCRGGISLVGVLEATG
jgi:hypothetical protein